MRPSVEVTACRFTRNSLSGLFRCQKIHKDYHKVVSDVHTNSLGEFVFGEHLA